VAKVPCNTERVKLDWPAGDVKYSTRETQIVEIGGRRIRRGKNGELG
jgi:hypothetical protein